MITIPNSGPTRPAGRRTSRPVPPPIGDHRPIWKQKRPSWRTEWEWFAFYLSLYLCFILIITTIALWPRTYDYHYLNNTTLRTNLYTNITEYQWGSTWEPLIKDVSTPEKRRALFYQRLPQHKPIAEPPDLIELGKRIKAIYPGVYDDIPDAELGRRVKAKYPTK